MPSRPTRLPQSPINSQLQHSRKRHQRQISHLGTRPRLLSKAKIRRAHLAHIVTVISVADLDREDEAGHLVDYEVDEVVECDWQPGGQEMLVRGGSMRAW